VLAQSFNFEEDWRWSHFTTESGLPSNNIMQTDEAGDGVIWAVSLNGLAWFDGYTWHIMDEKSGLPSQHVLGMNYFGPDSNIIVSYVDKTFIGNRRSFHQLENIRHIECMTAFNDKFVFISTNYEFCTYKNGTINVLRQNAQELYPNNFGDIWFTADSGLYFLSKDNTISQKLNVHNNYIRLNFVDENTRRSGLLVIDRPTELEGIWEWDSTRVLKQNTTEIGNNIVTFAINEQNDVICVYKSGLVRMRRNNRWFTPPYVSSQLRHSKYLVFSKNGDLWVTTDEGVFLYRTTNSLWTYHTYNALDLRNNINEILYLQNGDIWLGTGNGLVIERANGTEEWIKQIDGVHLGAVTGLEQANDGAIWLSSGSTFSGTFRWDGTHWKHFDIGKDPANTMFHKIRKDKKGNLWFLGLARQGFRKNVEQPGVYLLQNQKFIAWSDIHHLPSKRVYAFAEGPDGSYWFATNTGIFCWQSTESSSGNDSWKQWTDAKSGLLSPRVFTLDVDKQGNVWFGHGIGFVGYGLGKINTSGTISYFSIKDGLIEDHVNDVTFDSSGTLWITTNGGLSSYTNGVWTTIGERNGLTCPLLWPVKPLTDKVLVGTTGQGLAIFNRNALSAPPPTIRLSTPFVEESKVFLSWQPYGYMGIPSQNNILTRYKFNDNNWSSWSTNRNLRMNDLASGTYTFQVQARDIYGQFVENGSHASFTILPPLWKRPIFLLPSVIVAFAFLSLSYSYYNRKRRSDIALKKSEEKFRVVSETTPSAIFIFNESSILYVNPSAVQLTGYQLDVLLRMRIQDIIHPQFHHLFNDHKDIVSKLHHAEINLIQFDQTEHWIEITTNKILFQGDDAILAAMFDVTERKNSELQLRTLAFELSRTEERERRHLASYLHDTISQNLAFLKLKFRAYTKSDTTQESEKRAEEMKGIIENLIQDSQTLTFELSPPILVELGLKAALDWLSERILERHHIHCIVQYDVTNLISYEIQSLLFHSIQELTTNVVKHAKATEIIISVTTEKASTIVSVQDNGIGLKEIPSSQTIGKTNGFGIFHIRQRMNALGGTLVFQNILSGGSRVTITLPSSLSSVYN